MAQMSFALDSRCLKPLCHRWGKGVDSLKLINWPDSCFRYFNKRMRGKNRSKACFPLKAILRKPTIIKAKMSACSSWQKIKADTKTITQTEGTLATDGWLGLARLKCQYLILLWRLCKVNSANEIAIEYAYQIHSAEGDLHPWRQSTLHGSP